MADFFRYGSPFGDETIMKFMTKRFENMETLLDLVSAHQDMLRRVTRELNIVFLLLFIEALTIIYLLITR